MYQRLYKAELLYFCTTLVPALFRSTGLHPLQDVRLLVRGEEVGDLPGSQDHTDVLKEGLILDLEYRKDVYEAQFKRIFAVKINKK